MARGTEDEQRDIDSLVELAPIKDVRSLPGTEVDVVTERSLGRRIRDRVLAEAVDL